MVHRFSDAHRIQFETDKSQLVCLQFVALELRIVCPRATALIEVRQLKYTKVDFSASKWLIIRRPQSIMAFMSLQF